MTDPNLIAETRAALDGVTPGPWEYRPMEHDDWGVVRAGQFQICQARNPENMDDDVLDSCRANKTDPWSANARFIAWCRDGVPALLSALETDPAVERMREALIWCSGSDDFQEGGKAREGWLKLCAPLIHGDTTNDH